jgi:hypothetical protein
LIEKQLQTLLLQTLDNAMSDEDSLAKLICSEEDAIVPVRSSDAPIGWTDTYVYDPNQTKLQHPTAQSASRSNKNTINSLVNSINTNTGTHFDTIKNNSMNNSIHSLSHSSDQYQRANVTHSADTIRVIEQIESEGMDYIDYDLILSTIMYIVTKFTDDKQLAKPLKNSNSSNKTITTVNGSILVFLSGWDDITKLIEMCSEHRILSNKSKYILLPLHGGISSAQQRLIFQAAPNGARKIIFATNIAETSITIDDVVFVLDTGKAKEKAYDPHTKMSSLSATWISQANAKQRSGRAGRVRRGICCKYKDQNNILISNFILFLLLVCIC